MWFQRQLGLPQVLGVGADERTREALQQTMRILPFFFLQEFLTTSARMSHQALSEVRLGSAEYLKGDTDSVFRVGRRPIET